MKSHNFVVTHRPRLADITEHPKMEFADYERRLTSLQGALQLVQQAYLGSPERALLVLEGWDTAGKGGVIRRLGWALGPAQFQGLPDRGTGRARARPTLPRTFLATFAREGPDRRV